MREPHRETETERSRTLACERGEPRSHQPLVEIERSDRKTRTATRPIAPTRQPSRQQPRASTSTASSARGIRRAYGPIGLGAEPADVYTIARGDLAAVVSDAPLEVLDPTRDNVLAHQRVNETVMKQDTVLPMSFGTVFKTHDDVVELLRSASDAFSDVLNKMEAKLEFGLKVVWDRDAIIRDIEQEDEDIRRVKAELQAHKGSTYFARMQYGRLVDAALQAKSERYVADIFAALRQASVAARSNKLIGERMILNAAFLVNRRDARVFDRCVKAARCSATTS